jgi:SnoaL-like domain
LGARPGPRGRLRRYVDAWNRHDADAIVALFVEGGTYSNPVAGQGLTGQAIASFAKGVFTAYPDVSFEIVSIGDTGGGLVATQWLGRATNTGPLADGSPPTVAPLRCRAELHSSGE